MKTPKRRKVWVTGHFDKGIKLAVSKAEALKFNPQQQPVRLVELRKGEFIVSEEALVTWLSAERDYWTNETIRRALRKVGKR